MQKVRRELAADVLKLECGGAEGRAGELEARLRHGHVALLQVALAAFHPSTSPYQLAAVKL